jgi:hypothetical protein
MDSEVTETRARRPRGRRLLVILAGAAVVAATIGVSAAMAAEPSGTGAGGAIPVDPAFTAFNTCMKDHGIDLGTPVVVSSQAGSATGVTGSITSAAGTTSISITAGDATGVTDGSAVAGGAITISPSDLTPVTGTVAVPAPIDDAKFKAASDACTPILDAAGIKSGAGTIVSGTLQSGSLTVGTGSSAGVIGVATARGDVTKMAADLTAYAACMRSKGIDQPDPVVDAKAGTVQLQMTGDPTSAAFQDANKACGASLPLVPLQVPAQP